MSFACSGSFREAPFIIRVIGLHDGGVNLGIKYTERTWGNDLKSLLDGHIEGLIKKPKGIKSKIANHSGMIGFFVFASIILGSIVGAIKTTLNFIASKASSYKDINFDTNDSIQILNQKIEYLVNLSLSGSWEVHYLVLAGFGLLTIVVAIALFFWVESTANIRPQSFILLSKKSINDKEEHDKKTKRDWVMFCVSIAASLIIGIISNILFHNYFST